MFFVIFFALALTIQQKRRIFPKTLNQQILHICKRKVKNVLKVTIGQYVNCPIVLQKCIFSQNIIFFLKYYLFGLRKSLSAEQCLLEILKKWKTSVDNGKTTDSLLTGLLKVLDGLDDKLFIVKVWTYGFNMAALKLIHDCL